MTRPKPQPVRNIACPAGLVIGVLRASREAAPAQLGDVAGFGRLAAVQQEACARELLDLGLVAKRRGHWQIVAWPLEQIVEHLSLAAAINALAAYQVALRGRGADFSHLEAIGSALTALDRSDPAQLLGGAYLDYQFHLELVRLSGNRTAWQAYRSTIPPAVWLVGANHFQLEEAASSLSEHTRLIDTMRREDALRARDAAAFHLEEAVAQIRKAGQASLESYPPARA